MSADSLPQIPEQLVDAAREFYRRGWMLGTSGNLSAVVEHEPLTLAITGSGLDKGALTDAGIVILGEQETHGRDASAEAPLHRMIVRCRSAGAVFHTHSIWATIVSGRHARSRGIWIEGYEMLKGLDGVNTHEHREWLPILENSQDMEELAGRIRDVLDAQTASHGLLIRRHGLYTWGADIAGARRHVEILEFLLEITGRMGEESWQY